MAVMRRMLCIALVAAPACMKHVYTYPKGNIPLVVTNNNPYSVCTFNIIPANGTKNYVMSWDPLKLENPPDSLGGNDIPPEHPAKPMEPGKTIQVSVKKGIYRFESTACDSDLVGAKDLAIDGALAVSLGPSRQPAPAGATAVVVEFLKPHYNDMSCIPDGEWRDYPGAECCTGNKHYAPSLGHYVCGP